MLIYYTPKMVRLIIEFIKQEQDYVAKNANK